MRSFVYFMNGHFSRCFLSFISEKVIRFRMLRFPSSKSIIVQVSVLSKFVLLISLYINLQPQHPVPNTISYGESKAKRLKLLVTCTHIIYLFDGKS